MNTNWESEMTRRRGGMLPAAPNVGAPGMGGGSVPYAPGSTRFNPAMTTPPPQGAMPEPEQFPQASNGAAQQPTGYQQPQQGQTSPMTPAQGGVDPTAMFQTQMAYANALVQRLKAQIMKSQQAQQRRY